MHNQNLKYLIKIIFSIILINLYRKVKPLQLYVSPNHTSINPEELNLKDLLAR